MAVSPRLVNPTPFDARIEYSRGVILTVPADGSIDITIGQMEDFMPGRPGSETVREIIDYHGLFLNDPDLSYEVQALRAIEAMRNKKRQQYRDFVDRQRNRFTANGAPVNEEAIEENIRSAGYDGIRDQVTKLEARLKFLRNKVQEDPNKGKVRDALDPEKTCFAVSPPKEFPSKIALEMFLSEHPEIAKEHKKLYAEMTGKS